MASLSGTYLGLPLTIKKVSNSFWNSILERMQKKLTSWKGRLLSSAGKLQLLASSLQRIPVYFLSLFKISASMAKKLERIQRTFLWTGMEEKKRLVLDGWDNVCYLKKQWWVGDQEISRFNKSLMAKTGWKLANQNADRCRIMSAKHLGQDNFYKVLNLDGVPRGSKIYHNILKCKDIISQGFSWLMGNDRNISFWEDCWMGDKPLASIPSLRRL